MPEMCETRLLQLVVRPAEMSDHAVEFRKSDGEHRRTLSTVHGAQEIRTQGRAVLVHGGGVERHERFRDVSERPENHVSSGRGETAGVRAERRDKMQHEEAGRAEGQAVQGADDLPLLHHDRRRRHIAIQQRLGQLFRVLRPRVQQRVEGRRVRDVHVERVRLQELLQTVFGEEPVRGPVRVLRQVAREQLHGRGGRRRGPGRRRAVGVRGRRDPVRGTDDGAVAGRHDGAVHGGQPPRDGRGQGGGGDGGRTRVLGTEDVADA